MAQLKFSKGILTLMVGFAPQVLMAWGDMGHKVVAEVASRNLTPKAQKMVRRILGDNQLVPGSTFPDFARSYSEWSEFAAYHFLDVDPRYGSYERIPEERRTARDANAMIEGVPASLFKKKFLVIPEYNSEQKASLLRYLVHIIGDVHQPLHVGNSYDRGGNLCNVYLAENPKAAEKLMSTKEGAKPVNLHAFWDGNVVDRLLFKLRNLPQTGSTNPWDFIEMVNLFEKDPEYKNLLEKHKEILQKKEKGEPVTEVDMYEVISAAPSLEWYREATQLHARVYPDKGAQYSHPEQRIYCKHYVKDAMGDIVKDENNKDRIEPAEIKPADVPVLTAEEIDEMALIAKTQLIKGGLRLARVLNDMAEGRFSAQDPEKIKKDLEKIKLENPTKKPKTSLTKLQKLSESNNMTCEPEAAPEE